MGTSAVETERPRAQNVVLTEDTLTVDLMDGRTISVPLAWYPRLQRGKPSERRKWRLIGDGEGIHWPDLDEDVSVDNLLTGKRSGETESSLKRWLETRSAGKRPSQTAVTHAAFVREIRNARSERRSRQGH